jgi:phage terminase Nu1 subunit (DNA packaging protein)
MIFLQGDRFRFRPGEAMATQLEVAAHIDLSDRQVRTLVADGVLPASKGAGGLDIDACRMAYIRYLRGVNSGQVRPEVPDEDLGIDPLAEHRLTQERLRLTSAQAEGQELKNEVTKRKSVPTGFATYVLSRLAAEIGSILDTLPMTLKRRHPDLEVRHIESVQRELAKARNRAATLDDRLTGLLDDYLDATD